MKDIIRLGIDISHWNAPDLHAVRRDGYDFVIIKAGGHEGVYYKDADFGRHYGAAREAGFDIGAYYYSDAKNRAEGIEHAEHFARLISGKRFEMPVYIDFESEARKHGTRADNRDAIDGFCRRMEELGYFAGFYSYTGYLKGHIDYAPIIDRFAFWLADYTEKPNAYFLDKCGMHQYSSTSYAPSGKRLDTNRLYADYPAMIRAKGLNGYPPASDVNGDGRFDTRDLTAEMRAVADGSSDAKYDINKDGEVNSKDLISMMNKLAGK